jgi:hypothetical protein
MARLPQPGSDEGNWGAILNEFLVVAHNADGTLKSVPVGGTTGQVLAKASNADGDTHWTSVSGTSVTSVNGQTGVVVLDADDIDSTSTTNKFVTAAEKTKLGNLSGTNTGDQDLSGYFNKTTDNLDNITAGTTNKPFTATEKTKLAGVEASADITDAANVAAAGAVMVSASSVSGIGFVIDEDTMASNLDTKVPTQQSTKAYVDSVASTKVSTSAALGYVDVSTGSESRPSNARVIWIGGTTQPTNMSASDVWLKEV